MNLNQQAKSLVFQTLRIFIFWLALFAIHKVIFLLFFADKLNQIQVSDVLKSFIYGIPLDISAACYILFFPFLFICLSSFFQKGKIFSGISRWILYIVIVFYLMISFSGIALYANWGQKINAKALSFLLFPSEFGAIFLDKKNIILFLIFLVYCVAILYLFRKFIWNKTQIYAGKIRSSIIFILFSGLILLGIRGGFQTYPINKSTCYYSKNSILNYAAMNDFWNFFDIFFHPLAKDNPYKFYEVDEAKKIASDLFRTPDRTQNILNIDKPNIIIIAMESFSADATASLGSLQGITPGFDSLTKEGYLFTDFYATGFRTDHGLIGLLCGFPSQPVSRVIENFGKFESLPNLVKKLDSNGYYTSYFAGSALDFANTNTFLTVSGIDYMAGTAQIPHQRETNWGAYDEDLFNFHLSTVRDFRQPFFSIVFTITNHEYFDADVPKIWKETDECSRYKNTLHYADACVYNYIQNAKKQSWYKNSIIIITGDHAHHHPLEPAYNEPSRHHIPFLILGGALNDSLKGKQCHHAASQTDVAKTILTQLRIKSSEFKWGNDFLGMNNHHYAFYTFDNGFGMIGDSSQAVFDHNLNSTIILKNKIKGGDSLRTLKYGKALLQLMFEDYINL